MFKSVSLLTNEIFSFKVTILVGSDQRYQPNKKYETLAFKGFLTTLGRREGLDSQIQDNKTPLKLLTNLAGSLPYLQLMQCESLFNKTNKVTLRLSCTRECFFSLCSNTPYPLLQRSQYLLTPFSDSKENSCKEKWNMYLGRCK